MIKSLNYFLKRSFSQAPNPIRLFAITARMSDDKKTLDWVQTRNGKKHNMDNALDTLLACVAECEQATAKVWAKKMGIELNGIEFKKFEADYDARIFVGDIEGPSRFSEVRYDVEFDINASEEKLQELKKNVEAHCPVYGMVSGSGVKFTGTWKKKKTT